jgi:hypothetical protein
MICQDIDRTDGSEAPDPDPLGEHYGARARVALLSDAVAEVERGKSSLIISEFRLTRASYEDSRWSQPFPQNSVCLMLCTIRLTTPAAFEIKRLAISALGIHALARRYQRGFDNTDHAIRTDIAELALNTSRLIGAESETFAIACPSGQWVGAIETASLSGGHDQRLLNVRSFLHHMQ